MIIRAEVEVEVEAEAEAEAEVSILINIEMMKGEISMKEVEIDTHAITTIKEIKKRIEIEAEAEAEVEAEAEAEIIAGIDIEGATDHPIIHTRLETIVVTKLFFYSNCLFQNKHCYIEKSLIAISNNC